MTTTENTTRSSKTAITRRKMLQAIAVTSAMPLAVVMGGTAPAASITQDMPPSAELADLIEQHRWALDAWDAAGFSEGAELDAEIATLNAILACPIVTLADMQTKARYLLEYDHDQYQSDMVELLLNSMVGEYKSDRMPAVDLLIEAINAYRAGLAAFNATPSEITELDEDGAIARTYGPPMGVLMEWELPARSAAGAVAALRLADDENVVMSASVIAENMVKAALGYFVPRRTDVSSSPFPETPMQALYRDWKAVRDNSDHCTTDEESQASYQVYAALQEQITAMKPLTAKDMAVQLVVETDFGDSDYREVFFERVTALAERP